MNMVTKRGEIVSKTGKPFRSWVEFLCLLFGTALLDVSLLYGGAGDAPALPRITLKPTAGGHARLQIDGGEAGKLYDLYATTQLLGHHLYDSTWSVVANNLASGSSLEVVPPQTGTVFLLLADRADANGNGIADAYELLVSKTLNGATLDADHDGLPDQWEIDHGMNPVLDESSSTQYTKEYSYDADGRLIGVTGPAAEKRDYDEEGNILSLGNP